MCPVTYNLKYKLASGETYAKESGITALNKVVKCDIPSDINITQIELTIVSKKSSKSFTTDVKNGPKGELSISSKR